MKINNWIARVQDRGKWKELVEMAKTFNYEVQRLEIMKKIAASLEHKTKFVWSCTMDARYQNS